MKIGVTADRDLGQTKPDAPSELKVLNAVDEHGDTLLHQSARKGDVHSVAQLLAKGSTARDNQECIATIRTQ